MKKVSLKCRKYCILEKVSEQVSEQVHRILYACMTMPQTKQELLKAAGLANVYMNYRRHIVPLLEDNLIELTLPGKSNSRLQKYRITEKGCEQVGEQVSEQVGEQVSEQVSEQVHRILYACMTTPQTKQELLKAAGLANVYMNYQRHIVPLLDSNFIELILPDKPNSRLQKYRITAKGSEQLKNINVD